MKIYTKTGKFKKAFRHQIYKYALDYCSEYTWGICYAIRETILRRFYINCDYDKIRENFPELMKRKPKDVSRYHYWWPMLERKKRISVLKACIRETK